MHTLFLSHSHRDNAVASDIRDWLHLHGFHSLFLDSDLHDGIPPGSVWQPELLKRLRRADAVLALSSEHFAASRWCFAEIVYAKAEAKAIIAVQLDDAARHELLADLQAVDFTGRAARPEAAYAALARALAERGIEPRLGGPWTGERSPYPGLASFQELDAAVFFGREDDTRAALAELRRLRRPDAPNLLVMLGASGCGKSSLLRAGMLPRLRANREWLIVDIFRPGAQPLARLAHALAAACERAGRPTDRQDIRALLEQGQPAALRALGEDLLGRANAADAQLLLIVDQLEEALIQPPGRGDANPEEEASRFLEVMRQLAGDRESPFLILATLRSDFLGDFQTHRALQGVRCATLMVAPLSKDGLDRVIRGPAEVARIELEEGLPALMVADTETPDALPLLAFTLRELYEQHAQDRRLTVSEYRSDPPAGLGGLQGALAQAAEDVIAHADRLPGDPASSVRSAFLSMVALTEHGEYARRPVPWSALPADARPLLEQFVQARLLVAREVDGESGLEVAHEALFRSWGRLKAWLDENRAFLLWRKDIEPQFLKWQARRPGHGGATAATEPPDRARSRLLRDDELVLARANLTRHGALLNPSEREYIGASIKAESRRRLVVRSIVGVTMAVLATATMVARQQSIRATERAAAAKRATLVATARTFSTDPTRAGVLMRETSEDIEVLGGPIATILEGHTGPVRAIAFSPDGRLVLTASEDNTARVWTVDGSADAVVLEGHTDLITVASFDPKGERVVTGSEDETARVWNVRGSGNPLVLRGHSQGISAAVFSPDGAHIVTAARGLDGLLFDRPADTDLRVWTVNDPTRARVLSGHTGTVTGVAFGPTGAQVVSASEDGTVRIWDRARSTPTIVLRAGDPLTAVAVSTDGKAIAAGGRSGALRIWSADGSAAPLVLTGHTAAVTTVAFAPDGESVLTGSEDTTARVWTLTARSRTAPAVVLAGHTGAVTAVAWSPDGSQIATASADATARRWTKEGEANSPFAAILPFAVGQVRSLGQFDASVQYQSLFDGLARNNIEFSKLAGHNGRLTAVAWSPDGRRIATASADGTARLWPVDSPESSPVNLTRDAGEATIGLSRDGDQFLKLVAGGARVGNADGSGVPIVIQQPPDRIVAAAFSPDAKRVATGSNTGTVGVWSLENSRADAIGVVHNAGRTIGSLFFDADGTRLAVLADELSIWDVADPRNARKLQTFPAVTAAAFTPDGTRLVIEDPSGFVIVNGASLSVARRFPADRADVRQAFRVTQDSRSIVSCRMGSGGAPDAYLLWDLGGDRDEPTTLTGYSYQNALAFDELRAPDGKRVPLYSPGLPAGDPCLGTRGLLFARSPNGRRVAVSATTPVRENGDARSKDDTGDQESTLTLVLTTDARTMRWRAIDYCFAPTERVRLLGETLADAERAQRCCQTTLRECRASTFGACAATVARNYADVLRPCPDR